MALGLLVVIGVLVALVTPAYHAIAWRAYVDVEIEFVVTDAEIGKPIAGANVAILYEDVNLCADRGQAPFSLRTNAQGVARRSCKECPCSGTTGGPRDAWGISIPAWLVQVTAPGYRPSALFPLETPQNGRRFQPGKDFVRLTVPVGLRRTGRPFEPSKAGGS
jgi:hypothetical protein